MRKGSDLIVLFECDNTTQKNNKKINRRHCTVRRKEEDKGKSIVLEDWNVIIDSKREENVKNVFKRTK